MKNWISVEEKMPNYEQDIIFCTKGDRIYCGCKTILTSGNKTMNKAHFIDYRKGKIKRNVTHWMPYPKPPIRLNVDSNFGGYCDEALRSCLK